MSNAKIIKDIDHPEQLVAGVLVYVTESLWSDGGRSFDVRRVLDGMDLTPNGSFDTMPTKEQIAKLDLCEHEDEHLRDGEFYCHDCSQWTRREYGWNLPDKRGGTDAKYYRTVFTVEVLSSGPYGNEDLTQMGHDVTGGNCSGLVTVVTAEEVTAERMSELLIAQGSDPGFLISANEEEN